MCVCKYVRERDFTSISAENMRVVSLRLAKPYLIENFVIFIIFLLMLIGVFSLFLLVDAVAHAKKKLHVSVRNLNLLVAII